MIREEKRQVKRLKRLRAFYLQLKIDGNLTPSEKRFINTKQGWNKVVC